MARPSLKQVYDARFASGELKERVIGGLIWLSNIILNDPNEKDDRKKWAKITLDNPLRQSEAFYSRVALDDSVISDPDGAGDREILQIITQALPDFVSA